MQVDRRQRYLDAVGITRYVPRERHLTDDQQPFVEIPEVEKQSPTASRSPLTQDKDSAALEWKTLKSEVSTCTACALHRTRTNTVFGVGDEAAQLMIVGEGPGADEDRQGEPFVGKAGQLLNAMLGAIGFRRESVYIANIVKCRPPGNRNPSTEEAVSCRPFLERQMDLVKPKVILALGGVAAHNLLNSDEAVGRLRTHQHFYSASRTPLMVTYHPAYLLRRPEEKAKVWQDLQKLYSMLHAD